MILVYEAKTHQWNAHDPHPGWHAIVFGQFVWEGPSHQETCAAPQDGAESQPDPRVLLRVIFLKVELGVEAQTVATWNKYCTS